VGARVVDSVLSCAGTRGERLAAEVGDADRGEVRGELRFGGGGAGFGFNDIFEAFFGGGMLFCGDTLFSLGCGRLFEGTAEQMWQSLQKIKSLPPETRVYCAHEYTQANGRFALTLDANNPALQQRLVEVAELRRQNQPTLPSTLGLELATNPFLREHSTSIRKALGAERDSPAQVFAKIRLLKDQFS
jgi:hydroxyacylglutathione hydrolase